MMEELARLRAVCRALRSQVEALRPPGSEDNALAAVALPAEENPNPVLRIAAGGVLLYTNPAAREVLAAPETGVGRPAPGYWRELAAQALAAGEPCTAEVESGGRTFLFDIRPVAQFGYADLYGTDVTGLRLAESEREAALRSLQRGEAETRRQRDLLEHIMEREPVGVSVHRGPNHRVEYANPAFCRHTRTRRHRILGKAPVEVLPGLEACGILAALDRVFRTGRPESGREVDARAVSATDTYWSYDAVPLVLGEGPALETGRVEVDADSIRPYGILLLLHDVTAEVLARRRAEAAASRYEQRAAELDAVLAAIPGGVAILGPDGEYLRTNQAARALLGLSAEYEQAPPEKRLLLRRYTFPDGRPAAPQDTPLYRALHGEATRSQITTVEHGGAVFWISVSAAPLRTASGQVTGAVVSLADVSELCRTREWLAAADEQLLLRAEQLRASQEQIHDAGHRLRLSAEQLEITRDEMLEARDELWLRSEQLHSAQDEATVSSERAGRSALELEAIFSAMPHSLVVFGPDGRIRRSNRAARVLFGLTPANEGTRTWTYTDAAGCPLAMDQTPVGRALRGQAVHDEIVSMCPAPGGPPIWLSVSAVPLHAEGGAVSISTDITPVKTALDELRAAHLELQAAAGHGPVRDQAAGETVAGEEL